MASNKRFRWSLTRLHDKPYAMQTGQLFEHLESSQLHVSHTALLELDVRSLVVASRSRQSETE